jgi:hypothetical protein
LCSFKPIETSHACLSGGLRDTTLSHLRFLQNGIRRASARARLRYESATPGKREVQSTASWTFIAPLGPIEAEELRWYLEQYAIWSSGVFHERAEKIKDDACLYIDHRASTKSLVQAMEHLGGLVRLSLFAEWRSRPDLPAHVPPLLDALEAILSGRRDPSLAQHPDLYYRDAAEILLLIETLARAGR